jgi:phosphatidate phosphatase LPIN
MTDLVDQMFPPIHKRWAQEYTDTNFWKPPMPDFPLPDLTAPPSPALSARSDTSTLSRLRSGFSLGGGGTRTQQQHQRSATELTTPYRDDDLRKMSSFERLGQTLGITSPPIRSSSPISNPDEEDERGDWRGVKRGGPRARSVDSMPGSLPGSEDDTVWEDDEEGEVEEMYDHEHPDEVDHEHVLETDEAFDEDVLAAGEMASVPFL